MNILGISAGFHDAAATVISKQGQILFAGHSERYSKIKNDPNIDAGLIVDIRGHCSYQDLECIAYYETPWKKQLRQLYSGQGIEWGKLSARKIVRDQLHTMLTHNVPVITCNHHLSHAAAGFQTSPYERATVVVIDAVGEWDSITIWGAEYVNGRAKYTKLWSQKYPHSIGLLYTALTEYVGLKPNEDEYILMGMSAYGDKGYANTLRNKLIKSIANVELKDNLHTGIVPGMFADIIDVDIAAGAQRLAESLIYTVIERARATNWSTNLVYMGGVALNCVANTRLNRYFDDVWIMPNPGDAGSSLGAAALAYGSKIQWDDAFLGHNIAGDYPVDDLVQALLLDGVAGVASGRAEFGPRALGNRSLLADPRHPGAKSRVNAIKKRQQFRPFAPVILQEVADQYFDFGKDWRGTEYMQSVAKCRNPQAFPAIVHVDGTSRVQTVAPGQTGLRQVLEKWYALTGCPMLLNTSLNIRGEPMVNDRADADRFEQMYGIKVFS